MSKESIHQVNKITGFINIAVGKFFPGAQILTSNAAFVTPVLF